MNEKVLDDKFFNGVQGINYVKGPEMDNFYIKSQEDKVTLALLINYSHKISGDLESSVHGFIDNVGKDNSGYFIELSSDGVSFLKDILLKNSKKFVNYSCLCEDCRKVSNFLEDNLYESPDRFTNEHLSSEVYLGDRSQLKFNELRNKKLYKSEDTYDHVMSHFK